VQHFLDPLGPPATPPDDGNALSAFGDALAADPLGLPPVDLPGLTGSGPGLTPPPATPDGPASEPTGQPGEAPLPEPRAGEPLQPAQPPVGSPPEPAATTVTTELPPVPPPAAPRPTRSRSGRISAGYPRGWDPPSVPASRGWSKRPARPLPQRGGRPPRAAPPAPARGHAGPEYARPPGPAGWLADLPRRAIGGRRPNGRLLVLALLVPAAAILAARTHNARLVLGVIVLGIGLGFVSYAQRLTRRVGGHSPGYAPPPADPPLRPPVPPAG
jgi:hypothetical protein